MEKNPKFHIASPHGSAYLSTEEFASKLLLRAQSIRKRYSQTGAYFNVRPLKLPNGRLMWPADSIKQLAEAA